MRRMNTAPLSGYGANLELKAAESPSKVYFYCKTNGQFGKGMVVSCKPSDGDKEVTVAFPGLGIKKLLLSFARLEKID